jgi:peptidoglycan-N-acetylglucosamine deacetylase
MRSEAALNSQKCIIMVRLILSTAVLFSLMSCGRNNPSIQTNIQSSVDANAESVTHTDWETSDYHPKFLFENLRQEISDAESDQDAIKIKKDLCSAFKNLSDDTLLIFETEIRSDENAALVENCKPALIQRMNDKSLQNRIDLKYSTDAYSTEASNIDFKLETKVINSQEYLNFNKYNASVGEKEIILTFDDGPHDTFTSSILKTLKEAGDAKAMFFELGKQIYKYPEMTALVHSGGHIVANHSWSHSCLNNTEICKKNNKGKVLTDDQVTTEIVDTYNLIRNTIGKISPFFRFPYGDNRATTSEYLKKSGVLEMSWNADSNDWRYNQKVGPESIPFTSKDVLASALRSVDKYNKGVVLFHDIHRRSAEILPQFLYELHKRNFKLVILDPNETEPDLGLLKKSTAATK